jgi:hypothetical protein
MTPISAASNHTVCPRRRPPRRPAGGDADGSALGVCGDKKGSATAADRLRYGVSRGVFPGASRSEPTSEGLPAAHRPAGTPRFACAIIERGRDRIDIRTGGHRAGGAPARFCGIFPIDRSTGDALDDAACGDCLPLSGKPDSVLPRVSRTATVRRRRRGLSMSNHPLPMVPERAE